MGSYQPPVWSAAPKSSFSFEVVKDGVPLEALDLSQRPHYVLGRHSSTADLVLAHPSVSRQHAVIQHRDTGEIYVMDLGSTHGTFMNKKRLEPHAYVPLRIGATVKLGQSTRSLVLMGEADPPPPGLHAEAPPSGGVVSSAERTAERQQKLAARTGKSLVRAEDIHSRGGGGAGWGFDDEAQEDRAADAEEEALEELGFEALYEQAKAKGLNMTAKQQRLSEQLERRVAKCPHPARPAAATAHAAQLKLPTHTHTRGCAAAPHGSPSTCPCPTRVRHRVAGSTTCRRRMTASRPKRYPTGCRRARRRRWRGTRSASGSCASR